MMTTQIIPGALRETNNPLLLKAGIGKPQPRGYSIPPDSFAYGKTNCGKSYGAGDTFIWQTKIKPLKSSEKSGERRDFITLNKAATQAGLVTAQEHFQYRATHSNGNKRGDSRQKAGGLDSTKLPLLSDRVFGLPTKHGPAYDFLEHKYQDDWLCENHRNQLSEKRKERELKKCASRTYSETCASRLRRYSPKVDERPLWQMPRFKNHAKPKLQTFRSEEARMKAFEHHISDSTSRTGVIGHGIYEDAKS